MADISIGMILIQQALANCNVMNIKYQALNGNQSITERLVEPLGLCFYGMFWHLIGFCKLRNDFRDFRVDRMIDITIEQEKFTRREFTLSDYFHRIKSQSGLFHCEILVSKKAAHIIQSTKYFMGFLDEESQGNYIHMNFLTSDLPYFVRWLLSVAEEVEILNPEELKLAFQQKISKIIRKMN